MAYDIFQNFSGEDIMSDPLGNPLDNWYCLSN